MRSDKEGAPVFAVDDLRVVFRSGGAELYAVNGVSFHLGRGELLGVVGESGCGKSVTMLSLVQLLPPAAELRSGRAMLEGTDLLRLRGRELRETRGGSVGLVFQDPMTSLNPVLTIGYQLAEPLRKHLGLDRRAARQRAIAMLRRVGLPSPEIRFDHYPHQLSGGMRQRVMIAVALACKPKILIADEPTTALDVTLQAQIIELVRELRGELGMSVIWITHDLGVIAGIADRVMVMYAGQIVESAPVRQIFAAPRHPYTQALLRALPNSRDKAGRQLESIPGQPPTLHSFPRSCPFVSRCPQAHDRCRASNPPLMKLDAGHEAACWLVAAKTRGLAHA